MTVTVGLNAVTFSSGHRVELPPTGVVALVGPNNAGKTAALREIYEHLAARHRQPEQPYRVITAIELNKTGDEFDFQDWLEKNSHAYVMRSTGQRQFTRPGVRIAWDAARGEWTGHPNAVGPSIVSFFVMPAFTEQRLGLVGGSGLWNPMEEGPNNAFQTLFEKEELERRLSAVTEEAFGTPLHLSRFPGGQIDLYLGTPTNRPSVTSVNHAYLDELRSMQLLREQGDGMRSFVGVMLR